MSVQVKYRPTKKKVSRAPLLILLMDYVWHCDQLVGEKGARLFCFSVVCGLYSVCHGLLALSLVFSGRL